MKRKINAEITETRGHREERRRETEEKKRRNGTGKMAT
jgi:hypothetical protein